MALYTQLNKIEVYLDQIEVQVRQAAEARAAVGPKAIPEVAPKAAAVRRTSRRAAEARAVAAPAAQEPEAQATKIEELEKKIVLTDEEVESYRKAINQGNAEAHALMLAAKYGKSKVVKALIKAGADVSKENHAGQTALMIAKKEGRLDVVKALKAARLAPDAAEGLVTLLERFKKIKLT